MFDGRRLRERAACRMMGREGCRKFMVSYGEWQAYAAPIDK